MGKLKVGFVLDDTLDTPDGVQQYILTLGSWMARQGHDVHYLVGATIRTDIANVHSLSRNIKVKFNGNRMSTPLPANKREIKKLLADEQFDVLHIMIPYSPFMAQRVILAAPAKTAIVGTFHIAPQSSFVRHANKALGILTRKSLKRFDTIVSVSSAAADFAKKTFGITTSVIPNVVDAGRFRNAEPYTSVATKPVLRIVYLGRLVPRKGCPVLLDAIRLLKNDRSMPAFETIICGRGPLEPILKKYVQEHELSDVVKFTGFVTEDDKAKYLKSADIAVFPSTGGESFGIVLIEAMAAEHPVVLGADNEGYRTVLEPYPDLLFPVRNPDALADKLRVFATDSSARGSANAWQRTYNMQFDVAAVGPRIIGRYSEALRSKRDVR